MSIRRALLSCAAALATAAGAAVPSALGQGSEGAAAGTRIAYMSATEPGPQERIFTAAADGTARFYLGPGNDPLISPSGLAVAAGLFGDGNSLERGPALTVYSTTGAAALERGDLSQGTLTPLAWSPDSRYLALDLHSADVRNTARRSGLAVLDMATGSLRTLATGIIYGASFAPGASDRIVYARAGSEALSARVDLYTIAAAGGRPSRITSDGRSLFPVWGPAYIAYDRERLRRNDAPVYQIWLRRPGSRSPHRLTGIAVRSLVSGLVPVAFSASGSRLLAEFEGQDTDEAWTVEVPSGHARAVRVAGRSVVGAGLSRDGSTLLVMEGTLEGPPSEDDVATVPFAGGPATLLVAHAAQPSWNG